MVQESSTIDEKKAVESLVRFVGISLIFILLTRTPVDADMWWHLRAGQEMVAQKQILLKEIFSFTMQGSKWVNAFWVSEFLLFGLYSLGGYFALTFFVSFSGASTFYLLSRRMSGSIFINISILILAAVAAAPIWGPRPQIISFFIVALLDNWLFNKRPHWRLPILFAIWANLHGGWIWGILLILAHLAGNLIALLTQPAERQAIWNESRSLIIWSLISAFAIGVNPNGIAVWKLPFQQVDVSMQIQEWLSPDFHRIDFHPFLWIIFLLLLFSPFAPKPPAWSQIIKVLGFSYLTFVAQRNIAIAVIVAAPLLADWINAASKTFHKKNRLNPRPNPPMFLRFFVNALIVFFLISAALGYIFLVSRPEKVEANYPIGAVEWIKTNQPEGPLFNSYNWGGFITWKLREYPVFIDGRADLYGEEFIQEWMEIANGTSRGLDLLDAYGIKLIFVEPGQGLISKLPQQEWRRVYSDSLSVIYQKIP